MSTTKDRLNAVQEIMNILEKFNSTDREQILRCVNGESNIESQKEKKQKPEISEATNVSAVVFEILTESYEDANEDMRYQLTKLEEINEAKDAMHNYLRELSLAAAQLECLKKKKIKIKLRRFRMGDEILENEDQSTHAVVTKEELAVEILNLELLLEETRNKRQEFTTMFEIFDQKANQLFNILSTVMKSIKEMNSSVIRNIL